jgi:mannose-1-phosphate guanylyltransferase
LKKKATAAVLCGGRGERMRPLTDYFQKTMVPVGPSRRPLLEYIVRLLSFHGIAELTLLTGYRTSEIRDYFRDGSDFGVKINYSQDREGTRGSLNALANALESGAIVSSDVLLIYYGDVLSELDITELLAFHEKQSADATLVLSKGYSLPVGVAEVRSAKVTNVREKPTLDLSVTTGCMTLGPKAMRHAIKTASNERTDLMTHFVPEILSRGLSVKGYYLKGRWYDVGNVTSYEKLNSDIRHWRLPFLAHMKNGGNIAPSGP